MIYFVRILFFALLLSSLHPCLAEDEKLHVGFIGSFSGAAQIYGDAARNGFELALDELGRDWITVTYEDDQFLPAKTVAAFRKLAGAGDIDLVVTVGSTPSNAVAPIAQAKGIPLIAWASDRNVSRNRSHVVRSYPSGFSEGAAAAKEALSRSYDSYGVFVAINDYTLSWKNGFVSTVTKEKVVFDEELSGDLKDFKPFLLRARSRKVANFVLCLHPGQLGVFARQVRELKIKAPIFGCEYLHDKGEIEAAQGALEKAWFPTVPIQDVFHKKYLDKYGNDSVISGAANHYDLAHVLHTLKGKKGDLVAEMTKHDNFTGAVGDFVVRSVDGDTFFDIPLVIKEVKSLS